MRTSPVHYIAPSAISITPNANGSQRDLAVYVVKGTKIKAYCPALNIGTSETDFQEWTLTGRNRRLGDETGTVPYTIYARLPKSDKSGGYLVFAQKDKNGNDKYPYVTPTGLSSNHTSNDWYVRLGDVSVAEDGQRTVTLDTGILGTQQWNNEWNLNPDALPLRIELGCTIEDEDVGVNPYVYWGQEIVLTATLTEGWTGTEIQRFDHWSILRKTNHGEAESNWLDEAREKTFSSSGELVLKHDRNNDDFKGAVATTFTIMAMQANPEYDGNSNLDPYIVLKSATITILAETIEKYELSLSDYIASYSPQTGSYSPQDGIDVSIRATDQRGDVFNLTNSELRTVGLSVRFAAVDAASETTLAFAGADDAQAVATIPVERAFAAQKSINVRLVRTVTTVNQETGEQQTALAELARTTIAFVRDGEDSKLREWIYTRRAAATTFSGAAGTNAMPSLITLGEINPSGVANGNTEYDNTLDEWVPNGWTDDPQGTDPIFSYEYASYRDYISEYDEDNSDSGHWGPFSEPKLWSHYGNDGTMTQRRYRSTNSPEYTDSFDNTADVPAGWWQVGQPTQISVTARYRWMIERSSTNGISWSRWSTPVIDTYLAEDGTSIAIKGEAHGHYANFSELKAARQEGVVFDLDESYLLDNSDDYSEYKDVEDEFLYGFPHPTVMRFVQSPSGNDWDPSLADIGDCYLIGTNLWIAQDSGWKNLGNIQGPKGDKGDDAVTYDIEFTESWAKATPEGVISARLRGYAYKIEGSTRTPLRLAKIRYGYNTQNNNTYAETKATTGGYFTEDNWFDGDTLDGYAQNSAVVFVSIIIDNQPVCTKHITIVQEAASITGPAGHTGRFYYYAGLYDRENSYRIEPSQAPYVKYTETIDGVEQTGFFMLDYGGKEPPYKNWPDDGHPAAPSFKTGSNTPWTQMSSEHQYYIARAFFGENAYLGSFIINGDWMISQHGGPSGKSYTDFDPSGFAAYVTNGASYSGFIPNFAVDGLTGKTYQNDAYVKGKIVATGGEFTGDMLVGKYGKGSQSIKIQPSDVSISGYNGTENVYKLSSKTITTTYHGGTTIENTYGYIQFGESYMNKHEMVEKSVLVNSTTGKQSIRSGLVAPGLILTYAYEEQGNISKNFGWQISSDMVWFGGDLSVWPTSKNQVPVGCVYLDGDTLKVRKS